MSKERKKYMGEEEKVSLLEDIQNMLGLKQKKKEESTEKDDDTAEMTE